MRTLMLLVSAFVLTGCNTSRNVAFTNSETKSVNVVGPLAIVYKTKSDYNNLVPVILSEDKTKIISFPHPSDIKIGDAFTTPTILNDGYLLDNRGIGQNVAFLKYTYEEYANFKTLPSVNDLYESIIDKNPIVEMCNCGVRPNFNDIKSELNFIIDNKKLHSACKTIIK
jgi:hypothetical protein